MRINKVRCGQFAGLRNEEISFDDGLNIIVGENESGKSTLIDLIYQLIFKDVRLDGRSDSDFIDKYFPKKVAGRAGDYINGSLVFETETGIYKLDKEWEQGQGRCLITMPDGTTVKKNADINEILKNELKYRSGVFNEIIFASQKRQQTAIASIMREISRKKDDLAVTRDDLASALTRAAVETGGVSMEMLEKKISEKISFLEQHWDILADLPEGGMKRGISHPWQKEVGEILKAYYDMETVRKIQNNAEMTEQAVETLKEELKSFLKEKEQKDAEIVRFQHYRAKLENFSLLNRRIEMLKKELSEYETVQKKWPGEMANMTYALKLRSRHQMADLHALFVKAQAIHAELEDAQRSFDELQYIDPEDIERIEETVDNIHAIQREIAGLNLAVKIKETGNVPIQIRSASNGELLEIENGEVLIRESAQIIIPGVVQLQLMPQGIDLDAAMDKLKQYDSELKNLLGKYREYDKSVNITSDIKGLKEAERRYRSAKTYLEQKQKDAQQVLGDKTWEMIRQEHEDVPSDIEPPEKIKEDIAALCKGKGQSGSIDAYIGGQERILDEYKSRYQSQEHLESMIQQKCQELLRCENDRKFINDIPAEYRTIDDPDIYDKRLRSASKAAEDHINAIRENIRAAERKLTEKSAEEYSEELKEKQIQWMNKKEELMRWKKIEKVFYEMKDQTDADPMEDIENHFREYLDFISGGQLELLSMNRKMDTKLASKDRALTYNILSEGTRETVSLAFRLAMLDHLYPEGEGLAVFDDPFTQMDPVRTRKACALIEKFSEKNQVIFVTCDKKYKDMLSGNLICL